MHYEGHFSLPAPYRSATYFVSISSVRSVIKQNLLHTYIVREWLSDPLHFVINVKDKTIMMEEK
jgi:hypothetical protein